MIPKSQMYGVADENNKLLKKGSAKDMHKIRKEANKKGKKYRVWMTMKPVGTVMESYKEFTESVNRLLPKGTKVRVQGKVGTVVKSKQVSASAGGGTVPLHTIKFTHKTVTNAGRSKLEKLPKPITKDVNYSFIELNESFKQNVKTEHGGAKHAKGFWGRKKEAKQVSKKLRRANDKKLKTYREYFEEGLFGKKNKSKPKPVFKIEYLAYHPPYYRELKGVKQPTTLKQALKTVIGRENSEEDVSIVVYNGKERTELYSWYPNLNGYKGQWMKEEHDMNEIEEAVYLKQPYEVMYVNTKGQHIGVHIMAKDKKDLVKVMKKKYRVKKILFANEID